MLDSYFESHYEPQRELQRAFREPPRAAESPRELKITQRTPVVHETKTSHDDISVADPIKN